MSTLSTIAVSFMKNMNRMDASTLWEDCNGFDALENETDKGWELFCQKHGIDLSRLPDRKQLLKRAAEELDDMDRNGIRFTDYTSSLYPAPLAECGDAPLILFYKGSLHNELPALSIVGTRKASLRCKEMVQDIITELKNDYEPVVIVSGLAYGIDITAHKSALENGLVTYAVMGDGLDHIYPAAHRYLAEEIVRHSGALISEFPCHSLMNKSNFLQRNRIIAGLSRGTLVAESGIKGGSMVTAKQTFSYSREVMALPGRPEDENSQGCNQLIKQDCAALVENGADIANRINLSKVKIDRVSQTDRSDLSLHEELVKNILRKSGEYMHIDQIAISSGLDFGTLNYTLTLLVLKNIIKSYPGNCYKITKQA